MRPLPKFSYNVTRDYPYKWFTPVAIIGGIVLTVLFSAINFFSTAYTMVSVTTDYPQDIETKEWTGLAHLLASKNQPKCDDAVLAVGSSFRTNHSLFGYQLISAGGLPATSYHNEPIDWCVPQKVTLDFSTWYNRPGNQINISAWGSIVTVDLECQTSTHYFRLQTQLDPISVILRTPWGYYSKPTWVIYALTHESAWAQVLMLAFWEETVTAMADQTNTFLDSDDSVSQHNLSHGYVELTIDPERDIRDDAYLQNASWVFFDAIENERYTGSDSTSGGYVHSMTWPQIWLPVDRFAKAFLSAVYLDLGLISQSQNGMVSDADTLRYWSANLSTIVEQSHIDIDITRMNQIVRVTDYDTQQQLPFENQVLGPLPDPAGDATLRAVISTTYMCQQPQLKAPFNIFISILVADLVFLRTAWSLYNLVVGYFLKRRHTDANVCDECLARKKADDAEVEKREETAHSDRALEVEEHTIELDYLGPPSPDIHRDDQSSAQSLLTHRHV
ncbi:hypothetical protein KCU77_g4487, partial [Aureobasidium melanogenum]